MKAVFALLFSVISFAADSKKIVFIGDSLTEGYGVSRELAYPSLIQKKAGDKWKIINEGISGSTSSSAPSRVTWAMKSKPDLIVLALGANDGLRGIDVKTIEMNLRKAIQACKDSHTKVLLVGIKIPRNYGADYVKKFESIYPRLAKEMKVPLIPYLLDRVGGINELNQTDGIHPNEKGHAIVADTVYKAIEKEL